MKIEVLKELANLVKPYTSASNTICIEHTFNIAKYFNIDTGKSEYCNTYVNCDTNEIEVCLYRESYYKGKNYADKQYKYQLTSDIVDMLIEWLKPEAVEIIKNRLEYEEKNKFRIAAEKIVSQMIEK